MSLRRPNGFISAGYDPLEVPNAPTIGTATFASSTSVSVTFTAPANVGGSAITSYVATARKTSDGTTVSGTGASSPVTISSLTTDVAYTVTVAAVNAFGAGPISAASNSVTPVEQQLWAWGKNSSGALGLGNTVYRSSPVQIGALTNWAKIASTANASLAVKADGTLWSWGSSSSGQLGQNNAINRSSPVQIGALTSWNQVTFGGYFAFATTTSNTLWGWGAAGGYAFNDYTNRSSPVQVGTLTNWSQVSSGRAFTLAVKTDGTLWSWGRNNYGQLGQNIATGTTRSSPVQVGSLTNWSNIAAGSYHALAIKTDGTLWTWGNNGNGQLGLGDGYGANRSSPVQVGALTNWAVVAGGGVHSLAVKTDGTLWTWGQNGSGRLGQNNTTYRSSPVQVGALTNWSSVMGGAEFSAAVKTDGTLWAWGRNNSGQLGLNSVINQSSPVQVGALTTWARVALGSRAEHLLAIKG
jgi:alpha-tubulin suppressor-like RCC1 family protein